MLLGLAGMEANEKCKEYICVFGTKRHLNHCSHIVSQNDHMFTERAASRWCSGRIAFPLQSAHVFLTTLYVVSSICL